MSEELYKEVSCARCGIRFTIEPARGEPVAAICSVCEVRINNGVAQRAQSYGPELEGRDDGEIR